MKRIQVSIPEEDLQKKIAAECKLTGLKEAQLIRLIVNKYFYSKLDNELKKLSK
jgi:hypothetical protein